MPNQYRVRLPYYSKLEAEFGIDAAAWRVLVEATFPAAKTVEAVIMALAYCRKRNLDPFKRVVHIVPMWNAASRKMVETVWPGIGELRTTAFRTRQFAGMDAAEVGPMLTETFTGSSVWEGRTEKREVTVTFPEWVRVTVYRLLDGNRYAFVGPKVYWKETYARWKNTDVPNDGWCQSPNQRAEKCGEAAALRAAFPEELGNEYAAEEMDGRTMLAAMVPAQSNEPPNPNEQRLARIECETADPAGIAKDVPETGTDAEGGTAAGAEVASGADEIIAGFVEFAKTARNIDELLEYSELTVDPHYDLWPMAKKIEYDRVYRLAADAIPDD